MTATLKWTLAAAAVALLYMSSLGCDPALGSTCDGLVFIPTDWPPDTWDKACPPNRHVEVHAGSVGISPTIRPIAICVCTLDAGSDR